MNTVLFIFLIVVLVFCSYLAFQDVKKCDIERKKRMELIESINDNLQEIHCCVHYIHVLMNKAYDSEFDD